MKKKKAPKATFLSPEQISQATAALFQAEVTSDRFVYLELDGPKPALPESWQALLLLNCHVAGTHYADLSESASELQSWQCLYLQREPQNEHDNWAIRVLDAEKRALGYVPRERNEVLARLMDAGKTLLARLEDMQWRGDWLYLGIGIYLLEPT